MTPIIIPLHHGGGKLKNDYELRIALRSIEKNFKAPFKIVIVGRRLPAWLSGAEHLYGEGLKSSLHTAAKAYPDGFIWWYDDGVLLQPTTLEEMKVTPAIRGWQKPTTAWAEKLDDVRKRLEKEGHKAYDYSRPHGPYWFDLSMVEEGFADWPGIKGKFPWESWILSKRDWPRCHGAWKQYYGAFKSPPGPGHRYLNYADSGNTAELRAMLEDMFPEPSSFEAIPMPLPPVAPGSLEVHTLRFGEAWWVKWCGASLDQWVKKSGYKLRVWKQEDVRPEYPSAKFCEIDMLKEFLQGDSEWLLYVDADVYVHPRTQGFAPGKPSGRFLIRPDRPSKFSRKFPSWCRGKFGSSDSARGWVYRNAGVWACDRQAAQAMLDVISPPYHEAVQEQHQWNYWLSLAAKNGMKMGDLPKGFNNWPSEEEPGFFYHLCGRKKYTKLVSLRARGLVPGDDHTIYQVPELFDYSPYRFAHCGTHMPMDEYHIQLLFAAAKLLPSGDRVAVEIGSYRGASTAALVEAVNQGFLSHLHVVEIKPTAQLRKIISMCRFPGKVTLHTKPSWELELKTVDLVFIDGDHKWPAVGDTLRALTWGASVICMHDSRSWPSISGTWGARLGANMLREAAGRNVFEDCESRSGMATHRGFFVSAATWVDLAPLSEIRCSTVHAIGESESDETDEEDPEDDQSDEAEEEADGDEE
jgi:hypothetical protein